jgi:hypothetical protein
MVNLKTKNIVEYKLKRKMRDARNEVGKGGVLLNGASDRVEPRVYLYTERK